jgi:hypothetical protein
MLSTGGLVPRRAEGPMPDQPERPERFKAEMPQIPGVNVPLRGPGLLGALRSHAGLALGAVAVVVLGVSAGVWLMRPHGSKTTLQEPAEQIEVPAPVSEPKPGPPVSTEAHPQIATTGELATPWSSKDFIFRNRLTGGEVPSRIIRLPGGAADSPASYWAFALQVPYGRCQLEYITDLSVLRNEYEYSGAHPMVGDPCSRTLFDPRRMASVPGGFWVRGAIAQGSAIRPPFGIEVQVKGNAVLATRME